MENRTLTKLILLPMILIVVTECRKAPPGAKEIELDRRTPVVPTRDVEVSQDADGTVTAQIALDSANTQLFKLPPDSALAGSFLAIPPGSLAFGAEITVQEGTTLASASTAQEIGLDSDVAIEPASRAVMLSTDNEAALATATTPMTLAISLDGASRLRLAPGERIVVVIYKVKKHDQGGEIVTGVILPDELKIDGSTVSVQVRYFGSYQVAYSNKPIEKAKEAPSATPIVAKKAVKGSPIEIASSRPLVANPGEVVEIHGKNLRSSLTISVGGRVISALRVVSETLATFVVPSGIAFGATNATAEQDGETKTVRFFFTAGLNDYPIITQEPNEVCAGVKYYNRVGGLVTGTKECLTLTADGLIDPAMDHKHLASMIVDDPTHRFVTDTQITHWDTTYTSLSSNSAGFVTATALTATPPEIGTGATPNKGTFSSVTSNSIFKLRSQSTAGNYFVQLDAPQEMTANATYTLPATPSAGMFLTTDGAGALSWAAPSGGGTSGTIGADTGAATVQLRAAAGTAAGTKYTFPAAPSPGAFLQSDANGNLTWASPGGSGDMTKATYDANADNVVDNAAQLGGQLPSYYANAANLASGTMSDARLSSNVTLLGQTIGTAEVEDGAIATGKLADGSITTAKLADGSVTSAKFAGAALTLPGNVTLAGAATFATGTGSVSLNGDTLLASGKHLALAAGGGTFSQTYSGTATAASITATSLTSGYILALSSTSTAATTGNAGLTIGLSGTNVNAGVTRYGLKSTITAVGAGSTNVAGYFSATGATNNNGLIVANGNVGIGTSAPTSLVHAVGNSAVNVVAAAVENTSPTGWAGLSLSATDTFDLLVGGSSVTDIPYGLGIYDRSTSRYRMVFDSAGHIVLGNSDGAAAQATTLRGASAPASTNQIGGALTIEPGNGTGTGGSGALIFRTAPAGASSATADTMAEIMRITGSGRVGIGTATPSTPFHLSHNGSVTPYPLLIDVNNPVAGLEIKNSGGFRARFLIRTNGEIGLDAQGNGTDDIFIDSGLVGIGTSSPAAALHIGTAGAASAPGLRAAGTWYTGGTVTTTKPYVLIEPNGETSNSWSTSGTGLGINAASGFVGNLLDARLSSGLRFRVDSTGKVTIPSAAQYGFGSVQSAAIVGSGENAGSDYLAFFTASTERIRIIHGGNVGIGTSSPSNPLTVIGSACVRASGTCAGSAAGYIYAGNTTVQAADYAEYFRAEETLEAGAVVGLNRKTGLARGYRPGDTLLGIVSTSPGVVGNSDIAGAGSLLVALMGQVPVSGDQVAVDGNVVLTSDGKQIGYLLAGGNVYINISSIGSAREVDHLKEANTALRSENTKLQGEVNAIKAFICAKSSEADFCR